MGFILIDNRPHIATIRETIDRFAACSNDDKDRELRVACIKQVKKSCDALGVGPRLAHEVVKLLMANNGYRAHKLVNVVNEYDIRLWLRLPFMLVAWPFRLVWRVIKLGLPS